MPPSLYFTSFPHPAPDPQLLNNQPLQRPKVRARNHHGARQVPPDDGSPYYYFTVDDQLVYLSFFQDWGPLNLAMVYKACILFHELLQVSISPFCCVSGEPLDLGDAWTSEVELHAPIDRYDMHYVHSEGCAAGITAVGVDGVIWPLRAGFALCSPCV